MPEQSSLHGYLEWTKQRIDEMDATLASLEVQGARTNAAIIDDLKKRRSEFEAKARQGAAAGEAVGRNAKAQLDVQWNAFEAQVKAYFESAGKQFEQQQKTFREMAAAQTKAWQSAAQRLAEEAAKAAAARRAEVDAAVEQVKAKGAEAEAQLQKLKQAGSESWSGLSAALAQSRLAFGRATQEAWDAIARAQPREP